MYMKCRPTSIFAVRSNIQKLFKDLCTMVLLDTIGNRRGYLCYWNFFDLRHNIVLFHFSIFLAFRLLSVMLTPRWLSLVRWFYHQSSIKATNHLELSLSRDYTGLTGLHPQTCQWLYSQLLTISNGHARFSGLQST